MKSFFSRFELSVVLMGLALLQPVACSGFDNWPQWRGADQTSLSGESNLPDTLSQDNLLWLARPVRVPLFGGIASL